MKKGKSKGYGVILTPEVFYEGKVKNHKKEGFGIAKY